MSGGLSLQDIPIETGSGAAQPSVAAYGEEGFILTWQEQDDAGSSLHFAHITLDGQVASRGLIARSAADKAWFVNWADFPSLAVLDNGDWVTFWLQRSGEGTYAYDIQLTRSTDRGRNWSEPLRLHRDGTESEHGFVSLAPAGEDRVLAIWLDGRNTVMLEEASTDGSDPGHSDHGGMTLRSAVVSRGGVITDERKIDSLTCDCCNTDVVRHGGQFVALYRDRSEAEVRDHSFSVLTADAGWSEPKTVYTDNWKIAACPVNGPALASNQETLLAVWSTMAEDEMAVRAATGNTAGFGGMAQIDIGPQVQGRVDAVAFGAQNFLISWLGSSQANSTMSAIQVAEFDSERGILTAQTIAELPPGRSTGFPRLASNGDVALIAWTEPSAQDSSIRLTLIRP